VNRLLSAAVVLALSFAVPVSQLAAQKTEVAKMSLKVGDPAPDFNLLSDQWKPVKLSDYRGKKNVFLAVYVLAFTGG
jgi:peroxiredoxin